MPKKKKKKDTPQMHAALAMAEAFASIDSLECVNLAEGRLVDDVMSTGSLILDLMLGGGIARGRMLTYYGPESSGKSTMIQEVIASAQRLKIPVTHYDYETSADPVYMKKQGVNLKYKLRANKKSVPGYFCTQPVTGEEGYRHILATLKRMPDVASGPPSAVFVIDSFAAMGSEEIDDETGEGRIGAEPRMHSSFLRQVRPRLRRKGAIIVGTNQTRTVIGGFMSGAQEEVGGKALRFYPDYRVMVTRRNKLREDTTKLTRQIVIWRTVKNRLFPPMKIAEDMALLVGRGIDKAEDASHFLLQTGLMELNRGKRKILLDEFPDKFLSWADFRALVEQPEVRQFFFDMLKEKGTYDRYNATMGHYNETYDNVEEDDDTEDAIEQEADEYEAEQKAKRKKKKGRKKTKKKKSVKSLKKSK